MIVPAPVPVKMVDLAGEYLDFLRICVIATDLAKVEPVVKRAQARGSRGFDSTGQVASLQARCSGRRGETAY